MVCIMVHVVCGLGIERNVQWDAWCLGYEVCGVLDVVCL